jgi:hypothetical protein
MAAVAIPTRRRNVTCSVVRERPRRILVIMRALTVRTRNEWSTAPNRVPKKA